MARQSADLLARARLRGRVRAAHAVRACAAVVLALVVGSASWVSAASPAAADCQPSEGEFCGELSAPDSESGSSSFSGAFLPESGCSLPNYLIPASELPPDSVPDWVPLESGAVCVQIAYSIQEPPTVVPPEPGLEQWQADVKAQLLRFQLIGLFLIFLLAALFMRQRARL